MKRKNNLYDSSISLENLYKMYNIIKKKMVNKKLLYKYFLNLNTNIYNIVDKLEKFNYTFGTYFIFLIKEPKYRIIMCQNLSDKIVNHWVSKYILIPALEPSLIDTNVATRTGKGSEYAFKTIINYYNKIDKNKEYYVLKIDIKKYFYNIDHEILYLKLAKKIKDKKALFFVKTIIESTDNHYINKAINYIKAKELGIVKNNNSTNKVKERLINEINNIPIYHKGKGLPIGNLSSQILAIFFLSDIDHFIKENLKHKMYIRYMDDLVIIDSDKNKLKNTMSIITEKLEQEKLQVNNKSNIYALSDGFIFLGYKFIAKNDMLYINYNKQTLKKVKYNLKYKKNVEDYLRSVNSYKGYFIRGTNKRTFKSFVDVKESSVYNKYEKYKEKYEKVLILFKSGTFYKCYYEDAYIMNYLFNYKIVDGKLGFPIQSFNKIENRLKLYNVGFITIDNTNIEEHILKENNYEKLLEIAKIKYEKVMKKEELLEEIKFGLENDVNDIFFNKLLELFK